MYVFRLVVLVKLILFMLMSFSVYAGAKEFSAMAVQQFPQGQTRFAKMYVGSQAVRREYQVNRQTQVDIYVPSKGVAYTLMPAQKIYQETRGAAASAIPGRGKPVSTNPCKGAKGQTCKLLGKEKIDNRQADKWEVTRQVDGKTIRALMWVDIERGQALRQFFPDGTTVELVQMGNELVNQRKTEKWVLHMKRPNGLSEKTFQWYDPELGIIIKEVMPGGYIRELREISLGKQSAELFKVPADYKKVTASRQR